MVRYIWLLYYIEITLAVLAVIDFPAAFRGGKRRKPEEKILLGYLV
jgi:hypothetical protein